MTHPCDGHVVQFYKSEDTLYGAVANFVGHGLDAGEPAVLIATEKHRREFCARLGSHGVDVERRQRAGQITLLDARETLERFTIGGTPEWDSFSREVGGVLRKARNGSPGPVRAFGEMVDLLWKDGKPEEAIRLEEFWNDLAHLHPFALLCAYPLDNFGDPAYGPAFERICRAHTMALPAEGLSENDYGAETLREICRLQQRATALEQEVERRKELERALAHNEEALRAKNDELEAALRTKDEFLAMLGHELRNPIAPILTATQLLRLQGNESREVLVIERQLQHLLRLVDDLLDISRITRGRIELRTRELELAEIVVRAIETSSPLLEQRRHRLEVLVPHQGLVVLADPERMAQVIANLLTNASKYSHPGSRIRVLGQRVGANIRLSVKDEGVGIDPATIDSVFDMFVQETQQLDRAEGGLGIGLAIVKSLVELHGGTVRATSDGPGQGSEFSFDIPASSKPALRRPSAAPSLPKRTLEGKRVMIVDDNSDAAELLAEGLAALGCEVMTAHDGPSALDRARSFRPEIALLDIGLPVMDGYELARHLRALDEPALRLVAVTGYGQERDRQRSRDAGFALHLVKPVDLDGLENLLTTLH
jgi:signal transduction histidine kinase